MNFNWIGKTDTPRLSWGDNGEGQSEAHSEALNNIKTERRGILLRGMYNIDRTIKRATASVCGLGLYRFFVNGTECNVGAMAPLETDYRKRVIYDEIDVTALIRKGDNVFGLELGNGRYSTRKKYWGWRAKWYGDPMAAVEIKLEYTDGETEVFKTDETWKTSYSAVTDNCFYDGEHYDARLEQPGWNTADFDDTAWSNAISVQPPCNNVEKNEYFRIQKIRELTPERFIEALFGYWICKFSENIPGRIKIRVKGERGAKLIIRYAENYGTELDTRSNRFSDNVDVYILKGEGIEEYEPHFTFRGFSACIISCADREAEVIDVVAYEIRSKLTTVGNFECDNEDINRLHDVILRTQYAALMSYPFDCPQRDERLGWLGDAHIVDLVCLYNIDMRKYYKKWFEDIHLGIETTTGLVPHIAPRVEFEHAVDWSAGYAIILWDYYLFYGDVEILERYYDDIENYYKALIKDGKILPVSKYGDWMSLEEGWMKGGPRSCTTLYTYYVLKLLVEMSSVTGRDEKKARYSEELKEYKEIILKEFFNERECLFDDGSQFAQGFAIKLDLIPSERKLEACEKLADNIKKNNYHLKTGILGSKYVMEVLSQNGYEDIAMKLILQPDYPGWLKLIEGKTTLSEKWDGSMSQNHCMFGSVDAIFYKMLGGINIGKDITIKPYFAKQVNHVKCSLDTVKGRVSVEWERNGFEIKLIVNCPHNIRLNLGVEDMLLDSGEHIFKISEDSSFDMLRMS